MVNTITQLLYKLRDGADKRPDTNKLGIANIAYMVSDNPMGPWSDKSSAERIQHISSRMCQATSLTTTITVRCREVISSICSTSFPETGVDMGLTQDIVHQE